MPKAKKTASRAKKTGGGAGAKTSSFAAQSIGAASEDRSSFAPAAPGDSAAKPKRGSFILYLLVGVIVIGAAIEVYLLQRKPEKPVLVKLALAFEFGSRGKDNGQFDMPQDVAVDKDGNIFVVDRLNVRVQKFNSKGEFLLTWGGKGQGHGLFAEPFSLAMDPAGKIWVLDGPANLLQRFETDGTFISQFMGDFYAPANVSVDSGGNIYVANAGGANVRKYSKDGERLATLTSHGSGKGEVADPNACVADTDGTLYVADTGNRRIQKLKSDGRFLKQWALPKETGGMLRRLLLHPSGTLYATDEANHCLWMFDKDLKLLGKADSLSSPQGERKLESPCGIACDASGQLYVTDISQGRVFRCSPQESARK